MRTIIVLGQGKKLFVSCDGLKKNRVGRLVKIVVVFLHYFFGQRCVFYACFQ